MLFDLVYVRYRMCIYMSSPNGQSQFDPFSFSFYYSCFITEISFSLLLFFLFMLVKMKKIFRLKERLGLLSLKSHMNEIDRLVNVLYIFFVDNTSFCVIDSDIYISLQMFLCLKMISKETNGFCPIIRKCLSVLFLSLSIISN